MRDALVQLCGEGGVVEPGRLERQGKVDTGKGSSTERGGKNDTF